MFRRRDKTPPQGPSPCGGAHLVDIQRDGSEIRLTFERDGKRQSFSLYGSFGVNTVQLRKELLE